MIENPEIRRKLRSHMSRLGVTRYDEGTDTPIRVVNPDAVPVRGSMHLATDSLASRANIDRQFRKASFRR